MIQTHAGQTDLDVVILGGGMSGLSLACASRARAMRSQAQQRTLVIEPRSEYSQDKTWCTAAGPTPFDEAITHSGNTGRPSRGKPICAAAQKPLTFESTAACSIAQQIIGASSSVALVGERAESVEPSQRVCSFAAPRVICALDWPSMSPTSVLSGVLLQHFMGWEIETDHDGLILYSYADGLRPGVERHSLLPRPAL